MQASEAAPPGVVSFGRPISVLASRGMKLARSSVNFAIRNTNAGFRKPLRPFSTGMHEHVKLKIRGGDRPDISASHVQKPERFVKMTVFPCDWQEFMHRFQIQSWMVGCQSTPLCLKDENTRPHVR